MAGQEEASGKGPYRTAPGKAMDAWNALAARRGLSAVKFLSPSRRKALAVRLQEAGGLDGWLAALAIVDRTPFLLGENERRWKVTFDFLLKQASFARVMEGAYAAGPGRSRDRGGEVGAQTDAERLVDDAIVSVPSDLAMAFAVAISHHASALGSGLAEAGATSDNARTAVVLMMLDMVAGEACRIARGQGREPDPEKWVRVTGVAFELAVQRTTPRTPGVPA